MLRVKNWRTFQHYSDRKPSWIKLHKSLLDNPQWFYLSYASRNLMIFLWLLASEHNDPNSGIIKFSIEEIAFRVRTSQTEVYECVKELIKQEFIEKFEDNPQGDLLDILDNDASINANSASKNTDNASDLLATCYQPASLEEEEEEEKQVNKKRERIKGVNPISTSDCIDEKCLSEVEQARDEYNAMAEKHGLAICQILNDARKKKLKQRLEEAGGIEGWKEAMRLVGESDFLIGQNDRGWKASFDFLLQQSSFIGLMEGKYKNNSGPTKPKPTNRFFEAGKSAYEELQRRKNQNGN